MEFTLHENKCVLLRLCPKHSRVLHDYTINSSPIQVLGCYRDLGILIAIISSDLKWGNHLTVITARAYKVLGLIRRSFSNGLSISAKIHLSCALTNLCFPNDLTSSKRLLLWKEYDVRQSKFILNDFQSTYKYRLISLTILPLTMQFELHDILCLKEPDTSQAFQIHKLFQR